MTEQAGEQIRLSSERSAANIRNEDEALANAAASERDAMRLEAIFTKPFPYSVKGQGNCPPRVHSICLCFRKKRP
eukprot:7160173-Pyramimonas_sp.AAC.1